VGNAVTVDRATAEEATAVEIAADVPAAIAVKEGVSEAAASKVRPKSISTN
jgi:hypothetical protein